MTSTQSNYTRLLIASIVVVLAAVACIPEQIEQPTSLPALSQRATVPAIQTDDSQPIAPNGAAPELLQLEQATFVEDGKTYEIRQSLPLDAILPIYNPTFIPASEVKYNVDELVIGVEIDGEAKAYPISVLRLREMVNDELGGIPILVTW